MSRQTPRKPRHSRQPSNRIPAVSDYESDAAAIHTDYAPPPPRTNTELNLSSWEKSGVEGTMFVCAQSPSSEDPAQQPRACVFILNRRGLDNVIVDLSRVSHAEVSGELVIMKVEGDWEEGDKVLGVWIHNDKDETREMNAAIIQEAWKIARSAGPVASVMHAKPEAENPESEEFEEAEESEESKMEDSKGKGKQNAENPAPVKPEAMKPKESVSKIQVSKIQVPKIQVPKIHVPKADVAKDNDPKDNGPKDKERKGNERKGKDLKVENSEDEDEDEDSKIDMPEVELSNEEKPESAGSESDANTTD
ncbi:hypothetical protein HYE67_009927 [Fusarium culmorum]|uniref:Uncharacterized protein n=1 Tax=Fusarium culmorum TaxID=5516 RepID=A0A2T4HA95_FUSCU|nr:hypothetical protein FCULG_00004869 [Fusarium culmorum]QPC67696.1 hypothetical protein HYE67_009927 [Fusarium culmorum]